MTNLTEKDITGVVAKGLRERSSLSQRAFWPLVGVNQASGCRYESADTGIPRPVRILLALYAAGLRFDTSTEQGIAEITKVAQAIQPQCAPVHTTRAQDGAHHPV